MDGFEAAKEKIIGKSHNDKGIGTLSEKSVHAILKNYYEPDEDNHEVALSGYVADIYNESGVIEIQTRQFNKMREKLAVFLNYYPVTIVYPVPREKWIIWIDETTGALSGKRKSPVKGNEYFIFPELYKIKDYLLNPNLRLKVVLLDMEEYRILQGYKSDRRKKSTRYDRIPKELVAEYSVEQIEDYMQFVPAELPNRFTSRDFKEYAHVSQSLAQVVLNILTHVGTVKRVGKQGRNILYEVNE